MRALLLLPLLAACAAQPLPPSARLPPAANTAADPQRAAILSSAYALNQPGLVSPATRARAAAEVEFLAADWAWNPRAREFTPILGPRLAEARSELRAAYAVDPAAAPQAAVDGFSGAARALERDDRGGARAALVAAAFPEPDRTLDAVSRPLPLPRAAEAASLAESELRRIDTQDRAGQTSGSGGAHP